MKQRSWWTVPVLDFGLMLLIYSGYYYGNEHMVNTAVAIMWVLIGGAATVLLAYCIPPVNDKAMVAKLQAMDSFWSRLDKQGGLKRLYDDATDIGIVLLMWIAGAHVTAFAYVPFMLFKAYSRTQGARQRLIDEARALSEQRE